MKLKHRKIGGFLVILVGSALLWFVSKYKDVYEDTASIKVDWINIPKKIILKPDQSQTNFNAHVKERGFGLLWHQFNSYHVELDFAKFTFERNDSIFFKPSLYLEEINEQTNDLNILRTSKGEIFIPADRFKKKRVALKKEFEVNFEASFQPLEIKGFVPDSVNVYGNVDVLDKVKHLNIKSKPIVINDTLTIIDFDLSSQFENLNFEVGTVKYIIRSAEMTEGTVTIPVELINVPESTVVKMLPENITLTYSTTVQDFKKVSELDFKVIIDYKTLNGNNASVTPEVELLSDKIKRVRLKDNVVQVLTII